MSREQYQVCRDCQNKRKNYKNECVGKCLAFAGGYEAIKNTSFIRNGKCQAYLTEDELKVLEGILR